MAKVKKENAKYRFWVKDDSGNFPIGPIQINAPNDGLAVIKAQTMINTLNEFTTNKHTLDRIEKVLVPSLVVSVNISG